MTIYSKPSDFWVGDEPQATGTYSVVCEDCDDGESNTPEKLRAKSIQIHCDIEHDSVFIPSDDNILLWANAPLALLKPNGELNLGIVDPQTIQELNKTYRKKDKATNVLSFPSQVPTEVMPNFLGDILICASVVAQEAQTQHKSLDAYWAHMIVHGILHLLGYDHTTEEQALPMETLEKQLLASLGFADPYQEPPYDL